MYLVVTFREGSRARQDSIQAGQRLSLSFDQPSLLEPFLCCSRSANVLRPSLCCPNAPCPLVPAFHNILFLCSVLWYSNASSRPAPVRAGGQKHHLRAYKYRRRLSSISTGRSCQKYSKKIDNQRGKRRPQSPFYVVRCSIMITLLQHRQDISRSSSRCLTLIYS